MKIFAVAGVTLLSAAAAYGTDPRRQVVIYDGTSTEVAARPTPKGSPAEKFQDLWVMPKDLTRATGFVIKPQGVCHGQLCFPLPKARRGDFIVQRESLTWFNLSEFARLLHQPVAHDVATGFWYFGQRPDAQNDYLSSLRAPNFTLPDINGKMHSLTDYRGKKVLLITWASW